MTRFLLILLLPLSCLAQGFGSFTHDQPYLAQEFQSSFYPSNIYTLQYWWVASDLTNSPVANWTDRVSGVIFTAVTNQPTWTTNVGVEFWNTNWMETSPLPMAFNGSHTQDNYVMIIFSQNDQSFGGVILGATNGTQLFGMQSGLFRWTVDDIGAIRTNQILDAIYTGEASGGAIYTNGVVMKTAEGGTPYGLATLGNRWGYGPGSGFTFEGKINEILIWTNTMQQALSASYISNLHNYATNKYLYSP